VTVLTACVLFCVQQLLFLFLFDLYCSWVRFAGYRLEPLASQLMLAMNEEYLEKVSAR
jgi:hypothetical protein